MNTNTQAHCQAAARPRRGANQRQPLVLILSDADIQIPDQLFESLGCHHIAVSSSAEVSSSAADNPIDLIILPLTANSHSTMPLIAELLGQNSNQAIIVLSRSDQINDAAEAMRLGARDCVFLPFTSNRLQKTINNVLKRTTGFAPTQATATKAAQKPILPSPAKPFPSTKRPDVHKRDHDKTTKIRHRMICDDASMQHVVQALDQHASSMKPVFIQGPRGTGKELLARVFHAESPFSDGAFFAVDAAKLDMSSLFNIWNSASSTSTSGVTLYLRNILGLSASARSFLETALNEKLPVSAANVRLITSNVSEHPIGTEHSPLAQGLFQRMNGIEIHLPALHKRGADITKIAHAQLKAATAAYARNFTGFTQDAEHLLHTHDLPGNIRQLVNVIWGSVQNNDGPQLSADMLLAQLRAEQPAGMLSQSGMLGHSLMHIERAVIEETIAAHQGSIPRAAVALGLSPSTIYRKRDSWMRDT